MSFAKPGTGETDYERYIRTSELLSLQKRPDQIVNDDELFFQCIHQSMEIWMKVAAFELVKITRYLDADELPRATHHLQRLARIIDYLGEGLPILETMAQADYHEIRLALGRGSGQDSPGFNGLLEELPRLWAPFERLLERHGSPELLTLFRAPHAPKNEALFRVAQALIDVDKSFQHFRYVHLQLARREIGLAVKSLKGVPARNLEQGILKPCFPDLWKAIEDLTIATNPVYG
jgi:tryptophan 2,3-dioxygenase